MFYCINYGLGAVIGCDNDQISITLSEGMVLRTTKKFHIGLFGALFVSYWFVYAYLIGLVGGHRSKYSHSLILGTGLRIVYFNIPIVILLILFYNFAILYLGWYSIKLSEILLLLRLNYWLNPYLLSQFITWTISDSIHLLLDTEFAKWKLYIPVTKYKDDY